jgi:hypothetical protein
MPFSGFVITDLPIGNVLDACQGQPGAAGILCRGLRRREPAGDRHDGGGTRPLGRENPTRVFSEMARNSGGQLGVLGHGTVRAAPGPNTPPGRCACCALATPGACTRREHTRACTFEGAAQSGVRAASEISAL